jgi:hypothetical protein
VLLVGACSSSAPSPESEPSPPPSLSRSPSQAASGYEVSDVRIRRFDDPVAEVVWVVSFDARWTGAGSPPAVRCRWQMKNHAGEVIVQDSTAIAGDEDDHRTRPVFPDEIPGQPVEGKVTCPLG